MKQILIVSKDNGIFFVIDLGDKDGFSQGYAKPLSLPYGIVEDALMPAKDVAIFVNKISRCGRKSRTLNIFRIVIRRIDETNLLTVLLFCILQAVFASEASGYILAFKFSQGKNQTAQHLLPQPVQHIGLVFLFAGGTPYIKLIRCFIASYTTVVPRSDVVGSDFVCVSNQPFKLHVGIAHNAGVGGSAVKILAYKIADDDFSKISRHIFINKVNA